MASLFRRSAGPAARQLLTLPRRLAASASAATPRPHSDDDITGCAPLKPPANWGVAIVPEMDAFVVERMGKYLRTLSSGIHPLIPFVDQVAFVHSLKMQNFTISHLLAVTEDGVTIRMKGYIHIKIVDPYLASYAVDNPIYAVLQLAKETMTGEVEKATFDKIFYDTQTLDEKIMKDINEVATAWGLKCLSCHISQIIPVGGINMLAQIIEAEGKKASQILEAERKKSAQILESEAPGTSMLDQANPAKGEAVEILVGKNKTTARGMNLVRIRQ